MASFQTRLEGLFELAKPAIEALGSFFLVRVVEWMSKIRLGPYP